MADVTDELPPASELALAQGGVQALFRPFAAELARCQADHSKTLECTGKGAAGLSRRYYLWQGNG